MTTSSENNNVFTEILHLGRQLRQTLDPVTASPTVIARVRAQLDANVDNAKRVYLQRRKRRKRTIIFAAVIGALVYALGLALIMYRVMRRFLTPQN
jgi:hypothetical protein